MSHAMLQAVHEANWNGIEGLDQMKINQKNKQTKTLSSKSFNVTLLHLTNEAISIITNVQ